MTVALNPCDGSEERFASFTISLDNDGDGLYDMNDPDCAPAPPANNPPVLSAIGNRTVGEGSLLSFTATATDPNAGQTRTFSLDAGAPAGAAITAGGAFTWTPTEAQGPGSYPITVRVTDNGSPAMSDSETITVTVNEVNAAPVLAPIGNRTGTVGSPVTFTAAATDADIPAQTRTFSLGAGAPAGSAINGSTGAFSWTPSAAGTFSVTVIVTDSGTPALNDSETITVTVAAAPVTLSSLSVSGPASVNEGGSANYTATATWSDQTTTNVTTAATWSENSSFATISGGALSASQVTANQTVTVSASYTSGGVTRTASQTVTINNVAATLSSITIVGPSSVNEGGTANYSATATWSDGTSSAATGATFSMTSGPATITSSGTLTAGTVTANTPAVISASYTSGGTTRTASATVNVMNVAATLTGLTIGSPSNVPENTSAAYTATATWSDGSTSNVTSSAAWTVAPATYASINAGVLVASEVPSDQAVTVSASYTADGVTKSASMTVTIENVEAPTTGPLTFMPANGATNVPVNTVISATVESGTDIRTVFNRDTFTLKSSALTGTSSVGTASPLLRDDDDEVCVIDGVVQGSIWYNYYRTKAVFTPNCNLRRNTTYVATVAVGSSGYLAQPAISQFTTVEERDDSDDDGSDDDEDDYPHDRRRSSRWSPYGTGKYQIDASYGSGSATSAPLPEAMGGLALRSVMAISGTSDRLNQAGSPEGYEFPDGMVSFMMDNVASGSTVMVKITFPSGIPEGSRVFMADENGFHEATGVVIDGSTVTMMLTAPPAGSGDQGNAIVVGPVGVAVPVAAGSGSVDLATSGSSGGCSTAGRTGSAGIDAFLILTGIGLMAWRIRMNGKRS